MNCPLKRDSWKMVSSTRKKSLGPAPVQQGRSFTRRTKLPCTLPCSIRNCKASIVSLYWPEGCTCVFPFITILHVVSGFLSIWGNIFRITAQHYTSSQKKVPYRLVGFLPKIECTQLQNFCITPLRSMPVVMICQVLSNLPWLYILVVSRVPCG